MILVLQAAAVTFVITRAGVFAWLRRGPKGWVDFVSCQLCVGFWVGAVLHGLRAYLWSDFRAWDAGTWTKVSLEVVGTGALVGAVALLFACAIDWMDALERRAKVQIK